MVSSVRWVQLMAMSRGCRPLCCLASIVQHVVRRAQYYGFLDIYGPTPCRPQEHAMVSKREIIDNCVRRAQSVAKDPGFRPSNCLFICSRFSGSSLERAALRFTCYGCTLCPHTEQAVAGTYSQAPGIYSQRMGTARPGQRDTRCYHP